jgi:hypothetical protein
VAIGPVYWGAYPGETLEKVMAVLVAQEHEETARRTPASGDGGVDLLTPSEAGWHVRQVKGFSGRMKANRRRQVEESFKRVLENPRLDGPIARWTLSVPIDATPGERQWFDDLVQGAPFPCYWEGETQWHSFAARYPYVIDYYLGNGRERVAARSDVLLSAARATSSGELSAADVAGHLEALRSQLNVEDPHYRYEFHTGLTDDESRALSPGLVLSSTRSLTDGGNLTVRVYARHRYSAEDAPITGQFTVHIRDPDRDIDMADAFAEFEMYGGALEVPTGALDISVNAPAGLGGSFEGGGGRLVSIPQAVGLERTRLRIEHPDDGVVAELGIRTLSATRGLRGGAEIKATDDADVLQLRIRLSPPPDEAHLSGKTGSETRHAEKGRLNFDIKAANIDERPVLDVLPALRLLAKLTPPHRISWLEPYGAEVIASAEIPHATGFFEPVFLRFLENLAIMQGCVRGTVVVPAVIPSEDARAVAEVAHMIRQGSIGGTWTELTVDLNDGVSIRTYP